MNADAQTQWARAVRTLQTAELLVEADPDSAASRAYYAAFHAVSALFALTGQEYTKHSALEAAVHRDLVHAGLWNTALGQDYTFLAELRITGDYGGAKRVAAREAREAVLCARRILDAVRGGTAGVFTELPGGDK